MTPLVFLAALLAGSATTEPGPALAQRLPAFEAQDQDARPRSFDSLAGPQGLLLVFFRSADW